MKSNKRNNIQKEIQPLTNNNYVHVYKDGIETSASPSSSGAFGASGASGSDSESKIQESVKNQAIDYTSGAIGGV